MPRLVPFYSSFTGGEVAETIYTRPDVEKYKSACQVVLNYLPIPEGGVTRRPGLRRVATVKDSSTPTIVRRFEFSTTQAYILEFGNLYMRFYKSNAQLAVSGTPVELTTPYTSAQLRDLDFAQTGDVLYIFHASHATRKVERYSDTCWRFRTVQWQPPPTIEYGARPAGYITPSAKDGDDVTLTAVHEDCFLVSDVGREILITAGDNAGARAGIKAFTDNRTVTIYVCEAFVNLTATCSGSWKITESPKTGITPGAATPVGKVTTLATDANGLRTVATFTADGSDCGKYVHLNGGVIEIQRVDGASTATGIIRGELTGTTKAESGTWSLEESLWSSNHTFPETGDFLDDRLYANAAHRIAGSVVGDYENFALGINDDEGVLFAINSKQLNAIRALVAGRALQAFTAGGQFVATGGGVNDAITPTNIRVTSETSYTTNGVPPLRIGEVTLFVTGSGRQLREFTVRTDVASDVYVAPDLLLLAPHLTPAGATIVDMAYQREPYSTLWLVRSDGVMLACSYRREENVVAWSRHTTCGQFESVAVIPHPDGDREQVWVTTVRTLGGSTVRSVERFDDCTFYYSQLHTDCAMTCNTGAVIGTMGELNYLASTGVKVVVDGVEQTDQTVPASGILTLPTSGTKVEVGLPYISELTPLRPELTLGGQTSQTRKIRWVEVVLKVLRTINATVGTDHGNRYPITFDHSCSIGEVRLTAPGGWDCGVVTIQQRKPLPSTILSLSGTIDLGGQ